MPIAKDRVQVMQQRSAKAWTYDYDVLVAGGGNAGLCAAITAREAGARVLLVEHAPGTLRGGNSRHTRNLRLAHREPKGTLTGRYPVEEYFEELIAVTAGKTDEHLARMMLEQCETLPDWMKARGVHFQPSLTGTLSLGRTNAFFLAGGKALVNAYYARAEDLGVHVAYETEVLGVSVEDGAAHGVTLRTQDGERNVSFKSIVAATGGFQANKDWLREAWGPEADNFLIRGTPYNKGRLLRNLMDTGCASVGDPTQGHMVAIDGRAPKFDGGIATRLDCVPFSIVVNRNCERFYDEGEDLWPKRYAIWGRLVAGQPDQVGYAIIDAKSHDLFMPSVFPLETAETIEALGSALGLDGDKLRATVREFNAACQTGDFKPQAPEGPRTVGLAIDKTNWARPLDTPPYYGYLLRPGITFTYLGLKVDAQARVITNGGTPTRNIFAAGEIMAGNILGKGYLAGTGMTIGTVFGRIAGEEAARHAATRG